MELLIAIGQGAGLAVACGLAAAVPLGLAALGALLLGFDEIWGLPGAVNELDDTGIVIGLIILGAILAAVEPQLSPRNQIVLRAIGGAFAFGLVVQEELPFAGFAIGLVLAGIAATVGVRLVASAARAGSPGAAGLIAAVASAVGAILALVPFVGYAMTVAVIVLAIRARRQGGEKYAGLRVLR